FQFGTATNPFSVFVDPYNGKIITAMSEWTRLSSAGIMLHGLTFADPYGSWALELLACWGIVLCVTGVYLWWPRGGARILGVFIPRWRRGGRTRWRDLHAVVGFYFATALGLYLATGLPWTTFWGGKLLSSIQAAVGQSYPADMTAGSALKSTPPTPDAKPLPLDAFVAFGLEQKLPGRIEIEMPATPAGTVHLRNRLHRDPIEKHFQLDLYTGKPVGKAAWDEMPLSQKAVALGIDLHEGALFGRTTQILSTILVSFFMFIAAAGILTWWKRRPQGRLDLSKPVAAPSLPIGFKSVVVGLGLAMPLLGLTFLVVYFAIRKPDRGPEITTV
ncbi:MAG TPA: PepSY domain-containing protein, partial [Chthoniobacteraceae bacterium]